MFLLNAERHIGLASFLKEHLVESQKKNQLSFIKNEIESKSHINTGIYPWRHAWVHAALIHAMVGICMMHDA